MSNWGQFDPNGPVERYERTRRGSHYLSFAAATAIIIFFAALDSVPSILVAAVTLASIMPGCLTFRELIEHHPKLARIAKVGFRRVWMLVVLGIAFASVIGVQLAMGAAWGGWAAAAIAPWAYLVEFFIARELAGSRPEGRAPA